MTRPVSKEIREKIVSAYRNGLGTINQIAKIFELADRTVLKFLKIERESGDLTPLYPPGRPPIIDENNLAIIRKIVLSNNSGTLQEYCDAFYKATGLNVCLSSMSNACRKLNLRRKKKLLRSGARAYGRSTKTI
jgi:transposase